MSWSSKQWSAFCVILDDAWPGKFPESAFHSWRALLENVDPAQAISALKRLAFSGARFRPSVSELLAEMRSDPDRPTFDEAFAAIYGPRGVLRASMVDETPEVHPLVESFVARRGLRELGALPLDDPHWGGKHRADLERSWQAHVQACERRDVAAIASGNPRRLSPLSNIRGALDAG